MSHDDAARSAYDPLLLAVADYTIAPLAETDLAMRTARASLVDALGCGFLALRYPECAKLLGPYVPGTVVPDGMSVPGTPYVLDPVKAAFDIGTMIRWLDYNDTWLAAEWGHPSDNLGAVLAAAAHASTQRVRAGQSPLTMRDVLAAMVKAHEIQGVLALDNSLNRIGLDHVLFVRVASTAVATWLLGGDRDRVADAMSHAFLDGGALRTYRQAPNTGPRKSWAAGDATSRAVRLALLVLAGEIGYPTALSTPTWGFQDVVTGGRELTLARSLGSYVMENVLFKISYPAEFHAQTALEAAVQLHPEVAPRLADVERVEIDTHESAIRIIDKTGPLTNPADRDHCLQYIVAVALLHGTVNADHYEDAAAADPRIDALRETMVVREEPTYSRDYLDPQKRSIASAVRVVFADGTSTSRVAVEYPIGHRMRRAEGIPLLEAKFRDDVASLFPRRRTDEIVKLCLDHDGFTALPVPRFLDLVAG